MADKNYVGNGRESGDYGIINISVCLDDLDTQRDITEYQGKKYLRLSVGRKREVDQYGKTHSVWVNNYVPDTAAKQTSAKTLEEPATDNLPF